MKKGINKNVEGIMNFEYEGKIGREGFCLNMDGCGPEKISTPPPLVRL